MSDKWWYGWVRIIARTGTHPAGYELTRTTDLEFGTAGQAKRSADALAGGLAKVRGWTVVETGADRV